MSNIIGNPFDSFVQRQIDIRQNSLGQISSGGNTISTDDLKYYTTKTPWLRLASSVNLTGEEGDNSVLDKLIKAGVDKELIFEDNLAKNFILQGGSLSLVNTAGTIDDPPGTVTYEFKKNQSMKSGLNYSNNTFNGAYGWGGLSDSNGGRGYVPMPGITSAQTTYYNRGALSKATIDIKCYSKAQFQLLDALYLRPGYTLLLEFGWSAYLNSNNDSNFDGVVNEDDANIGTIRYFDGFKSAPLQFLLKPDSYTGDQTQFRMLELISEERVKHSCNYEAVYGKITNFKWSFGSDGSYTCTVSLIGMGDLIESLKLNVTDPEQENNGDSSGAKIMSYDKYIIQKFDGYIARNISNGTLNDMPKNQKKRFLKQTNNELKLKSTKEEIEAFFKPQYVEYTKLAEDVAIDNNNNNPLLSNRNDTKLNKIFYDTSQILIEKYNNADESSGGFFAPLEGVKNGAFILGDTFNGDSSVDANGVTGNKKSKSAFIKFGLLLKIIEENCNLFSKKAGGTPMIQFDFSYTGLKYDENYMLIVPPHISTNPQKCLVPFNRFSYTNVLEFDNDFPIEESLLNDKLITSQDFLVEGNPFVGRLGNVLINLRFASSAVAQSTKDSDGAISVLSYVKTILQGINESMGSINDFFVSYDESEGVIKIYDETPKPNLTTKENKEFAKFNIFGVKKQQGSFITNIGLDAEIPKELATLITIGASSLGNNLMGNAVSFQNYNKGLIDRIIPSKLDSVAILQSDDDIKLTPVQEAKALKNKSLYSPTGAKITPLESMYLKKGGFGVGAGSGGDAGYNFTPALTSDLTSNYTTYIQLVQGILSSADFLPPPFFLPFNLNLEMEGLSGMKLFEKFRISDDILPPSYEKDSVDIIVKAINHNIDVQSWKTTIDTQSMSRFSGTIITGSVSSPKVEEKKEKTQEPENLWETYVNDVAWSAAMISYTVSTAGVRFPNSSAHANYAQQIRSNTLTFSNNPGTTSSPGSEWKALPPNTPLEIGDIIIQNRSSDGVMNNLTFNSPVWKGSTHGDIVTEIDVSSFSGGKVTTIGGNIGNTVKKKTRLITQTKLLKNRGNFFTILRLNYGPKNADGTFKLAHNIAGQAKKEDLFFAGRNELEFGVKDRLYAYYKSTPELMNGVDGYY